jgi:hypothetical protein
MHTVLHLLCQLSRQWNSTDNSIVHLHSYLRIYIVFHVPDFKCVILSGLDWVAVYAILANFP